MTYMRNTIALLLYLAAASAVTLGCSNSQKPPLPAAAPATDQATQTQPPPVENGSVSPADGVTVEVKDFDGIQELLASKRGRVVVMDCWSTWCDPCVKEFPGLVALHTKYSSDDLACISLSFNYEGGKTETPEEHIPAVLDFLRGQKATFDNVIASVPSEELYQSLGFKSAAIPAIFVYDRDGNIAKQFESAEAKYSEVGKLVADLIEKPSTSPRDAAEQR
jgi:thiol-disulfide isomerase/thioredoxin